MEVIKFNVNHNVRVKLNKNGLAELKKQHDELRREIPRLGEFKPPNTDENGYSTWQLHSLMNHFGHMMTLGFSPPFETEILIDI
jgi:hypothetical protein